MAGGRPMAALSSTLLARKGQARPAMRRQGTTSLAALAAAGDDLGWNDIGEPASPTTELPETAELPLVLEERAKLAAAFTAPEPVVEDAIEDAPVEAAVVPVTAVATVATVATPAAVPIAGGRKAAFTLRLDGERHLRLRLASAVRGRSAQLLVTEALDALIAAMPEVETLRGQLPPAAPTTIVRGS